MIVSKTLVIRSHFEDLTDPWMTRTKRHQLIDTVAIALCARNVSMTLRQLRNALSVAG